MTNLIYNNHHDMMLVRHGNGLKWVEQKETTPALDKDSLFQMPACVYFMDTNSSCVIANEISAATCGWDSPSHFHGRSVFDSFDRETAKRIALNHQNTMLSGQLKFTEEEAKRKDDSTLSCLTLTLPWLNDEDKITGIFGCSIIMDQQPIAAVMTQLISLNLLTNPATLSLSLGMEIGNSYLSKREMECLQLCVRGKSAVQTAKILGISNRTVESYLENIKFKLNVSSKSELIDKVMSHIDIKLS